MNNAPQVEVRYLLNYDLEFVSDETSELNALSNLDNVNNQNAQLKGKKGLILSGGSVDKTTGEVSGALLDGTYTFFKDSEKSYNGLMGNELSNDNYAFETPQYITIRTKQPNTYISSLILYFDPVATEFATEISFSNAKKIVESTDSQGQTIYEEVEDDTINGATIYKNKNMIFLHNFGEESTLTQVQVNINKWSKKNSLMKILKIVTGYTGIYDRASLLNLDFTQNKTNDSNELRFGVTNNDCTIKVLDNDLMIKTLYEKDLIYKNIQVQIRIDGISQGIFYINEKSSEKGINEWIFDCVDKLESIKDIRQPLLAIAKRNVYELVMTILGGFGLDIEWEKTAKEYCENLVIEKSYFESNQTTYDLMLKCCQVGLLRIYIDRNEKCKITSGVK